ncbi:hypothetical protein KUTeg_010712 [Tegillarca granosa]|uniref:Fibrinogen C-terminal domain-containing protein n=1 Tax=Tegillarca granosa TaxID=220873 RepID=A0ABQ9F4Z9_TEGGR|nr:hypothetical protein KUTeg_010712 [Tegillarca granosa]
MEKNSSRNVRKQETTYDELRLEDDVSRKDKSIPRQNTRHQLWMKIILIMMIISILSAAISPFITILILKVNLQETLRNQGGGLNTLDGSNTIFNHEILMDTLEIFFKENDDCKCLKDLKRKLQKTTIVPTTTTTATTTSTALIATTSTTAASTTPTISKATTTIKPTSTKAKTLIRTTSSTGESLPKDCSDIYSKGERKDGIYRISPNGRLSFPVYCDLQNGGWVIIQRRINGNVNFDRLWEDYAEGFGNMSGEFWLGLRYIYVLTEVLSEISFEFVIRDTGLNASAVYNNFTIENEKNFFRMHVGNQAVYNKVLSPYITRQNGFYYHNNMKFTTRDTVDSNVSSCAKYYRVKVVKMFKGRQLAMSIV